MQQYATMISLGLLIIVGLGCGATRAGPNLDEMSGDITEHRIGEYSIIVEHRFPGTDLLTIRRAGENVYSQEGEYFVLGALSSRDGTITTGLGNDVLGDGNRYLVVTEQSGRVGPVDFIIFRLEPHFRFLHRIATPLGGVLEDINNDGCYEVIVPDFSYGALGGWSLQLSPAPEVVLSYHNGHYLVDGIMMRARFSKTRDVTQLSAQIQSNIKWKNGKPPVELYRAMLDYMYAGYEAEAWTLFEASWPAEVAGQPAAAALLRTLYDKSLFGRASSILRPPKE